MKTIPCPLCGYHAPESGCPHCRFTASERSLARPQRTRSRAVIDGLYAVPMGFYLLATTPRILHLLIPPVFLTTALFTALAWWSWHALSRVMDAARTQSLDALELEPGWMRDAAVWLLDHAAILALAKLSGFVLFAILATVVALWTFSIAYEAFAGPFLDEVHGRIEKRWFGADPWKTLEDAPPVAPVRAALFTSIAAIATLAGVIVWRWSAASYAATWLLLGPAVAVILAFVDRAWAKWLAWWIGAQLRTLYVSVKASALAGVLLVLFFWVKFIPLAGLVLFAGLAGFCTSISLLDIPFSRRRWSLMQRLEFLMAHFPAVATFGAVAGLLFVVPFLGPLVGVPAASVGGLWLLCRLDKRALRPAGARGEHVVSRPSDRRPASSPAPHESRADGSHTM